MLKTERSKREMYKTRSEVRAEVVKYIEFFYNPNRGHGNNDGLSPVDYGQRYFEKLSAA